MGTQVQHITKYKNSPLGLIPEDWEVRTLGEVSDYIKGFAFSSSDYRTEGIRIIRISDTTSNSIKDEGAIYINCDEASKFKKWELKLNDLVFTTVGSRPPMYDSMVGKVIKIEEKYKGAFLNQNAVIIRSKEFANQEFIFNQFKVKRYLDFIETIVRGNANQVSITLDNLFKYQLLFPSYQEQKAIADCLSTWDKAIDNINVLISQKETSKKALMQQLLSGKKRLKGFSGEWKEVHIKDVFKQIKNVNDGVDGHSVMTISSKLGLVSQEDKFDRVIAGDSLKKYTQLRNGDFAYNKGNSKTYPMGCIYQLEHRKSALVPFVYICFSPSQLVEPEFYKQWFFNHGLDRQLNRIITSGARGDGLLNVNTSDFFNLKIIYPPIEEQKAIAMILKSADDELQLLKKKLEQLKKQKKGLMQVLLTGKKRLKY